MLAVQKSRGVTDKCTPNILPCKINHTGPSKVTKRLWSPSVERDGSRTSYFRGRKLRGQVVTLPAGYEGVIWKQTDKIQPQQPSQRSLIPPENEGMSDEEDEEAAEAVRVIEQVSTFDNIVVWGHDQLPPENDAFVRGVQEWIQFAEAIHTPSEPVSMTS